MSFLACVTMAYNEKHMLPLWLRHYGTQVGIENCYVIDHGSNDGSTRNLRGASRIALPRSALDETQRCAFVSDICGALLRYHDSVLYADTDEFIVADPARYPNLAAYAQLAPHVSTCLGMNVVQIMPEESKLDVSAPLLAQRRYAYALGSMCKPLLIRRRVTWTPGFHSYDGPFSFGDLMLFHMAYADRDIALGRQRRRNRQIFADDTTNEHHRQPPSEVANWMRTWSALPRIDNVTLATHCPQRSSFIAEMEASGRENVGTQYGFDLQIRRDELWQIPDRFRTAF